MPEFAYVAREVISAGVTNASKGIDDGTFGPTAAILALARAAVITALATNGQGGALGGVNYLYNGADPTTAEGHHLPAGSTITIRRQENIALLHFIRSDGVDAVVTITLEY